jgi:hypothetical protein
MQLMVAFYFLGFGLHLYILYIILMCLLQNKKNQITKKLKSLFGIRILGGTSHSPILLHETKG